MYTKIKTIEQTRKELKNKIKSLRTKHYKEMFKTLTELLNIEQKLNPKYTMLDLAKDNDLSQSLVYRIMSWRYATPHSKQVVRLEAMTMAKVCRVISKIGNDSKYQDKVIKYVMEHKLTDDEMDIFITKNEIKGYQLKKERKTKSEWNIGRNITTNCLRLKRNLLSIKHIPKKDIPKMLKELNSLKEVIDSSLEVLKKNDTK